MTKKMFNLHLFSFEKNVSQNNSINKTPPDLVKQIQPWTKYLRQNLVFMKNSALREKFGFYFSAVFWIYSG